MKHLVKGESGIVDDVVDTTESSVEAKSEVKLSVFDTILHAAVRTEPACTSRLLSYVS